MLANLFGPDAMIVAVIGVVVLVAGAKLPKLARNLGEARRELRRASEEDAE
jgi:Sec-independent protein translocase protein TatA